VLLNNNDNDNDCTTKSKDAQMLMLCLDPKAKILPDDTSPRLVLYAVDVVVLSSLPVFSALAARMLSSSSQ
jgi:hypothetical protein